MAVVRDLAREGLTPGRSGNASALDREAGVFWITPSGIPWCDIRLEDLVGIDLAMGDIREGRRKPSTEWRFHRALYQTHGFVGGVVHVHSCYATVLAVLGRALPAVHYQLVHVAREVPLVPYETFGTAQLAQAIVGGISDHTRALLLQNHGQVAVGTHVHEAYEVARDVEWVAEIYYKASLMGRPRILTPEELDAVEARFQDYGQDGAEC